MNHLLSICILALGLWELTAAADFNQFFSTACPRYEDYSKFIHHPLSRGAIGVPFQRPVPECRSFVSESVDGLIREMSTRLKDKDLARLFENCVSNTLDTTIKWHDPDGPQTFVITGDITAMWLRDSTFQLQPYLRFASDQNIQRLILGAVQTQASYIIRFPYCNAFQPPIRSGLSTAPNGQRDQVHPPYDPRVVFECKYEIDSLSAFLKLSFQYYEMSNDSKMFTAEWLQAVQRILQVLEEQSQPSFDQQTHLWNAPYYTFKRNTDAATETLALGGAGYPVNANTSLIRSAFRPSDDSTMFQFNIPGNAMLSVELLHLSQLLDIAHEKGVKGAQAYAKVAKQSSKTIRESIFEHAVFQHPVFGKVFAYEIDGYGSRLFQDDANRPSLLSLPLEAFVDKNDEIYLNTRRMVLNSTGNPYFFDGTQLSGGGSPHTPTRNVWPMALMMQIMTSDDEAEITGCLSQIVSSAAELGLMHESVNVSSMRMTVAYGFMTDMTGLEKRGLYSAMVCLGELLLCYGNF